jgi:decaprenylphospho-beta-D-erythro-pentofuranosid-2-ulose 2-reductase
MSENVVVVGATSGIARALCEQLAGRKCGLLLAGRDLEELERCAADLRIRFQVDVCVEHFDASNFEHYREFVHRSMKRFASEPEGFIVCYGVLPDQEEAQQEMDILRHSFDVNLVSVAALLEIVAAHFERRGFGYVAAISSVAGDRGRQSNYLYGSPKAGLSAYLQGLRNRLYRSGVHVLTIKPGFVATRMSAGRVNPKSPLLAAPQRVARQIDRAIRRRRNVIYTPGIWRLIMCVICAIPEAIFKRLRL